MYQLNVLPSVRKEIIRIRDYIADDLSNVDAALKLMRDMQSAFMAIKENPYAYTRFSYERELQHEYRKKSNNGYILLFWVDEVNKIVTVSFIFYKKMNYRARIY